MALEPDSEAKAIMAKAQRAPEDYSAPIHVHKLDDEVAQLLGEAGPNPSRRAAKTLSKDSALDVVLMAILGGTVIQDHSLHGSALLQVLRGQVPHQLAATEDTALLLVLAGA